MHKTRLDLLMTERGLAESRAAAQRLVMAGQVRVNGQVVVKPSVAVDETAPITVDSGPRFVSRGGEKLEGALKAFPVTVEGKVCADVGASTGGFTDCLLQAGAVKVYAIDVAHGELHWKLRNDPRVVVMERTNARHVERLPEFVSLVSIDASFISLKILLPVVKGWFEPGTGTVIALIKPQFEAGRAAAAKGRGVISDRAVHRQVLNQVLEDAAAEGYRLRGLVVSPLRGPKGNIEFLVHLSLNPEDASHEIEPLIDAAMSSIEEDRAPDEPE